MRIKYFILFTGTLVMLLFISVSTADLSVREIISINHNPNTETICFDDGTCNARISTSVTYHQDHTGIWRNVSDVFRIGKNEDDIIFYYTGHLGNFSVTFESGVVMTNENYFNMSAVRGMYPQIEFDFPQKRTQVMRKYAVNITDVPMSVQPNVEYVTLTYKEHTGFTLDQFISANNKFNIKGIMQLGFQDLIDNNFSLLINKSEKRVYIGNLTFVDNSLYLDPTVQYEVESGAGAVYTDVYGDSWNGAHDSTDGEGTWEGVDYYAGCLEDGNGYEMYRAFTPIDTSGVAGYDIINATFCAYIIGKANGDNDGDDFMVIVANTSQADVTNLATSDINDCGAVNNPHEVSERIDLGSISTNSWECWNITNTSFINKSGITKFGMREGHDVLDKQLAFFSANWMGLDYDSNPAYLNITYTDSDSCTYSSGNWGIDCSDECQLSDVTDVYGNNVTFYGTGNVTVNTNITNASYFFQHSPCNIFCIQPEGCLWTY